MENGQHYADLLWSPERPTLLDAELLLTGESTSDVVASYLGICSIATWQGQLLLNDHPFEMRSVLQQGYWPETHLAASPEALRRDAELIKELGLNSARIHQKVEDPRFLWWCDRLGIAVWAETANAYSFSPRAVARLTKEWIDVVRRDVSHPSIIAWVPINESWGVPHGSSDPRQRAYTRTSAELTRHSTALVPSCQTGSSQSTV